MANDDYGRGGWDRDDRFGRGGRERNDWRGAARREEGGEYERWGRGYRTSGSAGNYDAGNYGDEEYEAGHGDREWRSHRLRDRDRDSGDRERSWQAGGRERGGGAWRGGYGPGGTWSSDRGGWGSRDNEYGRPADYGFEGGAGRAGYGGMPPGEGYDRFTGGGIGGAETEWGRGYGGGYGRSADYGERGGRGAWGRGQQAGVGPDAGSSNYGGYGYSSGFADMSQGRTSSYDSTFGARSPRSFAGRGPRNYRRSDERIREDINEELTRDPDLDATDIDVRVEAGTVTLTGQVDSRHAKRLAEDISESVTGVQEVDNQLRIQRAEAEQRAAAPDREVTRSTARESGARRGGTAAAGGAGASGTSTRTNRSNERNA